MTMKYSALVAWGQQHMRRWRWWQEWRTHSGWAWGGQRWRCVYCEHTEACPDDLVLHGTTGLSACQACLRGTRGFFPQRRGCKLRNMMAANRLEAGLLPHLSETDPPSSLIDASHLRDLVTLSPWAPSAWAKWSWSAKTMAEWHRRRERERRRDGEEGTKTGKGTGRRHTEGLDRDQRRQGQGDR